MNSSRRARRRSTPPQKSSSDSDRSRSPHRSRSSSRGTFDGFDAKQPSLNFPCKQCQREFGTIRELSEHEIRMHDAEIGCYHCDKKSVTVAKLESHTKHRHENKSVGCFYCDKSFASNGARMKEADWDEFRDHVYKEVVKKRMYKHGTLLSQSSGSGAVALRGVGTCPHGPPVKCKNFPQCPGAKCIYSHSTCRYGAACNKQSCPFDHPNRPRTCMSCVNDMKDQNGLRRKKRQ